MELLQTNRASVIYLNFSVHPVGKLCVGSIMIAPFRMISTSSTSMQSLREIKQRASAVGAKIWRLYAYFFVRHASGLPALFVRRDIL